MFGLSVGTTEDREYVVSNLRTFNIEVVLVNEHNELAVDVNLGLVTSLLYENGLVVQRPNDQEQLLTGETEVVIIGGTGKFVLKMGPSVLSSKMGKQRFRIIDPVRGWLSQPVCKPRPGFKNTQTFQEFMAAQQKRGTPKLF